MFYNTKTIFLITITAISITTGATYAMQSSNPLVVAASLTAIPSATKPINIPSNYYNTEDHKYIDYDSPCSSASSSKLLDRTSNSSSPEWRKFCDLYSPDCE